MMSIEEIKSKTIKKYSYVNPSLSRMFKSIKNGEIKNVIISAGEFHKSFIIENVNDMFVVYFKDSFTITDKNGLILSRFGEAFNA